MLDDLKRTCNTQTCTITGTFPQKAARGWYWLGYMTWDNNYYSGTTAPHQTGVQRFGVGEVFLISGQSNSTNWGSWQARLPAKSDWASDSAFGTTWTFLQNPTIGSKDAGDMNPYTGGSPWTYFADAMIAALQVPVAIVSTGWGGTSILQWRSTSPAPRNGDFNGAGINPFRPWNLFGRLASVGENLYLHGNGFRAILWYQGENDAGVATGGMNNYTYRDILTEIVRDFRTYVPQATATRFYVGGASWAFWDQNALNQPNIRRAQRQLQANGGVLDAANNIYPGASMDDNAYVKPDLSIGYDWGQARDHYAVTPPGWPAAPANYAHLSLRGLQMHGARWKNVLFGQAGGNDFVWGVLPFPAAP